MTEVARHHREAPRTGDPTGLEMRPIRDEIERRVRRLLDELAVPMVSGR